MLINVNRNRRCTMKWLPYWIGALLPLLNLCAFTQNVNVNYNQSKDFSNFHTYAWGQKLNLNSVKNPELAQEVRKQINEQLQSRGLTKVLESQNPNLVLVVSGGSKRQTTYGNYDASGTILTAGTDYGVTNTTNIGALVVDIYDVQAKQVVWRGTAMGILNKNNAKNLKMVDDVINEMFKKYPYPLSTE